MNQEIRENPYLDSQNYKEIKYISKVINAYKKKRKKAMSSCSNESMKRAALDDNSDFRSCRSVVLNRRSALAFVPVRNNLFQFYSLM